MCLIPDFFTITTQEIVMPWEWELRDKDDDNDTRLARFVILAEKSQAVREFIKISQTSKDEASRLPASPDDFHQGYLNDSYDLVEKIYNALCRAGVEYARSEDDDLKQKIRTPKEILCTEHKGNCLDLTILFCALCWHYGLLPILIYVERTGRTHVLAAVSLKGNRCDWNESNQNHEFSQGLGKLSNADELREIIRQGGYIAIECTGFGKSDYWNQECQQSDKLLPFNLAEERGQENLASHSLKFAIDIAIANYGRYWWRGIIRDYLAQEKNRSSINNPITIGNLFNSDNPSDSPYVNPKLKLKDRNLAEDACEAEVIFNRIHCESVTRLNQIENSTTDIGHRLAIIGEPGGGKTMLLLQIAEWVREKRELAIWISLPQVWNFLSEQGHLTNKDGLRQYLFEVWLPKEVKETTQSLEECKETLKELLDSKKVWLLLDGANEIAPSDALNRINDWLIDGLNLTRIVLTCRFNEWEMSKNSLTNSFNVYTLCGYEYQDQADSQVHKFIHKWFKDEESKIGITQEIRNHVYLQSLSKNPLSLAMLCYIFGGKGKMPETKAELYLNFEKVYYQRKEDDLDDRFKVNIIQRKTLRQTMGELAVKAFHEESTPLELREEFITNFFGNKPELINGVTQFELVCKWGWLNEDDRGGSYKFFHSSFQEYFAATAIPQQQDGWHFFLHHIPENPKSPEASYRIFDSKWKEVILLWLGLKDVSLDYKRNFINELVNFDDGKENFYPYRAYFLAAEGIAEIHTDNNEIIHTDDPNRQIKLDIRNLREQIERTIQQWSKGNFKGFEKSPKKKYIEPVARAAIATLPENNRSELQANLDIYIRQEVEKRKKAVLNIAKINAATVSLENNIHSGNLGEREIEEIVEAAKHLKENSPVLWKVIERLGEYQCKGQAKAIDFLRSKIVPPKDAYIFWKSAYNLAKIVENTEDINQLGRLFRLSEANLKQVAKMVEALYLNSNEVLPDDGIKNLISLVSCEYFPLVVTYLKPYLEIDEDPELPKPECYPTLHRFQLLDYLFDHRQSESERFRDCYKTLWYCAQIMSYPDFYEAWIKQPKSILQELYPGKSLPEILQKLCPALSLPNILPRFYSGQSLEEILQELCPGLLEILQELYPGEPLLELMTELF